MLAAKQTIVLQMIAVLVEAKAQPLGGRQPFATRYTSQTSSDYVAVSFWKCCSNVSKRLLTTKVAPCAGDSLPLGQG